jgi:ubiquinone/menaquinone biosynthesis C-methylase UbiE
VNGARSLVFAAASVPVAYDRFFTRQMFEPWARELVARAQLETGMSVLDVASGTGVVARLAGSAVGPGGQVIATDISAAMLAVAADKPLVPGSASIEYRECSASALDAEESAFERVLCQHGLQFFPDREKALREMHRVLEDGGVAAVSTWAAEHPLGLFGAITECLRDCGLAEPYQHAFDTGSYVLGVSDLQRLLQTTGFRDVLVETVELDCVWETIDDALATVSGTSFGPLVSALPGEDQTRVRGELRERLGGAHESEVTVRTASNIGRGVK